MPPKVTVTGTKVCNIVASSWHIVASKPAGQQYWQPAPKRAVQVVPAKRPAVQAVPAKQQPQQQQPPIVVIDDDSPSPMRGDPATDI
jgi:hypothetical protein